MSSFPPFGEDLYDADNNPLVTWDLVANLRVEHLPDGTTQTREFDADELLLVDEILAAEQARLAREANRNAVKLIVDDLRLEKDRAQTVIDNVNSTPREKDLARSVKRIADATIELAKFVRDM